MSLIHVGAVVVAPFSVSVEAEESVATVFDFVVTCVRSAKHRKYFKKIFLAFNANQLLLRS